jgi:hypothetical protein
VKSSNWSAAIARESHRKSFEHAGTISKFVVRARGVWTTSSHSFAQKVGFSPQSGRLTVAQQFTAGRQIAEGFVAREADG